MTTLNLRESVTLSSTSHQRRVDREKGEIYSVKVLGFRSRHGYTYDQTGVDPSLYEGCRVCFGHVKPGTSRPLTDTRGWLEGVYKTQEGLFAKKLKFADPTGAEERRLLALAEHNPRLLALSHSAVASGWSPDRKRVLGVRTVESCDLVPVGASNNSLFEGWKGEHAMSKTVTRRLARRISEAACIDLVSQGRRRAARWLREQSDAMGDVMAASSEAPGGSHQTAYLQGVKEAIAAVLDDDNLDWDEKMSACMSYLKAAKKLASGMENGDDEDDPAADPTKPSPGKDLMGAGAGAESGVRGTTEGFRGKRPRPPFVLQEAERRGPRAVVLGGRSGLARLQEGKGKAPVLVPGVTGLQVPDPRDKAAMSRFLRTGH